MRGNRTVAIRRVLKEFDGELRREVISNDWILGIYNNNIIILVLGVNPWPHAC